MLLAKLRGIPTAICEQNSIPGLTNKILGRLARARVPVVRRESRKFFKPAKIVMTGNPVRRELVAKLLAAPRRPAHDARIHVLVCGGSLGAVAVNELAAQALIALAKDHRLAITHQTGEKDLEATARALSRRPASPPTAARSSRTWPRRTSPPIS